MSYKSKRYSYEYDEYEDGKKGAETMLAEIMADAEFASLEELVIGCWGEAWEDNPQPIVDGIVANAEQFSHISPARPWKTRKSGTPSITASG